MSFAAEEFYYILGRLNVVQNSLLPLIPYQQSRVPILLAGESANEIGIYVYIRVHILTVCIYASTTGVWSLVKQQPQIK